MRGNRLGCLSGTGILAALLTVFVIAGYAYARGGLMYSPGPLNTHGDQMLGGVWSHAETGGECKSCHVPPWSSETMAHRCTACHTNIAEEMRDVATVHGTLMHNDPTLGCRHCHPEHRGADAPLTVMEDAAFPHEVVGFYLTAHQQTVTRQLFQCDDCHQGDVTTFKLQTCDTCHRQMDFAFMTAHSLSFGSACLDCHDGVDRFGDEFDHNAFSFQLTGKHMGLACVQCHINARGFGDFPVTPQDCYSCHHNDEPHGGQFGTDCAACHTTSAWIPAQFTGEHSFPLDHGGGATCATCHPGRFTTYTCYGCHEHSEGEVREKHLEEDIVDFQNCMECHPSGKEQRGERD